MLPNASPAANGIEPTPLGDPPPLVFAGRLTTAKDLDTTLGAVARVDGASLVVVGDGPDRARLEQLRDEPLGERVRFVGSASRDGVLGYLRGAEAMVLSSAWENFPHGVVESLALGTPVIATRVGGVPEIVSTARTGCSSSGRRRRTCRRARAAPRRSTLRARLCRGRVLRCDVRAGHGLRSARAAARGQPRREATPRALRRAGPVTGCRSRHAALASGMRFGRARLPRRRVVASSRSTGDATFLLRRRTPLDGPLSGCPSAARAARGARPGHPIRSSPRARSKRPPPGRTNRRAGDRRAPRRLADFRASLRLAAPSRGPRESSTPSAAGRCVSGGRYGPSPRIRRGWHARPAASGGRVPRVHGPRAVRRAGPSFPAANGTVRRRAGALQEHRRSRSRVAARRSRVCLRHGLRLVGAGSRADVAGSLVRDGLATWDQRLDTPES